MEKNHGNEAETSFSVTNTGLTGDGLTENRPLSCIRYMIDVWENECPNISSRIDILTTLYNTGKTAAHPNPQPNAFGTFVQSNSEYISKLLYG